MIIKIICCHWYAFLGEPYNASPPLKERLVFVTERKKAID